MKTYLKILIIISILIISIILYKFVHIIPSVSFFIIGMFLILYFGFIKKYEKYDKYIKLINNPTWDNIADPDKLSQLPIILFINLQKRTDRLRYVNLELEKIKYPKNKINRVNAVLNNENGHKGCLESHIKALKMGLESDEPIIMIIEDDIKFLENSRTVVHTIIDYIQQDNWNVLLLDCGGINIPGPLTKETKNKCSNKLLPGCATCTCYIIKREYIQTLLNIWEPTVGISNWKDEIHCCDQTWKILQDERWIVVAPKLVTQVSGYSNTSNSIANHKRYKWDKGPSGLPIELTACQRKMTNMFIIFDKICKDNGIKYWAMYGTLLGVIRHKGWIPHDGDMDLGILQEDYDKFKKISWKLPKELWLQDKDIDPNYHSNIAKIRDLNSCYIEYTNTNKNGKKHHNGLQIDLFIFNPNNKGKLIYANTDLDSNDIFPLKTGLFEEISIPIPQNSHKILQKEYGNYMKLPPKEKQIPHEGDCWTNKTCPHHHKLYPHLYQEKYDVQISYEKTPRVCWIFWFGSDIIPDTRLYLIDKMKQTLGVKIILITCDNIKEYIKEPIHAGVPYLSGIQKSDYFRSYFLFHYGGGYSDIKNPTENWQKYFDILDTNPSIHVIGSPEIIGVPYPPGHEYRKDWYKYLICNCHFICKPHSNYMEDLMNEQHKVLDLHYKQLSERPKSGLTPPIRNIPNWDPYPIRWSGLFGELHAVVNMKHVMETKRLMNPIDTKTVNYKKSDVKYPEKKPIDNRTIRQRWIDEDFLKPHTLPPPTSKKILAVSGYWNIDNNSRKNSSHNKYTDNFNKTTNFNTDYLIYGDNELTSLIKSIRGNKTTYTQNLDWNDFIKLCESQFDQKNILQNIKQNSMNDPMHCPSPELLLIWISKVLLVKKAIEMYPEYSHYGWIDTGYKGNIENIDKQWPTDNLYKVKGFYVKRLKGTCHDQFWKEKLIKCPIGGMWFGDKSSVKEFVIICINIIQQQLHSNKTVCVDQDIFELALRQMTNKVTDIKGDNYDAIFI
jgi:phosphorylcholine metabolism protein LicD